MHVCLFDIDGTLLNTGGAGQAAMEAALTAEFGASGPVTGIPFAGRTDRAIAGDLFRHYGIESTDDAWARFVAAYLCALPAQLAARRGTVLPGVASLLARLAEREDVLLGLLTGNFEKGAQLKLRHYRLHHHFRFGGYGDRHLDRDDVAREAIAALGRHGAALDAARVWVVGDTPSDVRCARAIGASAIAVATGSFRLEELAAEDPDHLFVDLSEASRVFELLDGAPKAAELRP